LKNDPSLHVLVVDFTPPSSSPFLQRLRSERRKVTIVSNPEDAIEAITAAAHPSTSAPIDLIVINIADDDDTEGFALGNTILDTATVPIVFVVDRITPEVIAAARKITPYRCIPRGDGEETVFTELLRVCENVAASRRRDTEQRRYETLLDAVADAVFMVEERSGTILEVSASACAMFRYSRDDLIGMHTWELSTTPERTRETSRLSNGKAIHVPERIMRRRDGTTFVAEIRASHHEIHGKEINITTMRDVTEHVAITAELQENEKRFHQLFDSMQEGVAIYRPIFAEGAPNEERDERDVADGVSAYGASREIVDFEIIDINNAGVAMSPLPKNELIGARVVDVFPSIREFGLFDILCEVYWDDVIRDLPLSRYVDAQIDQWVENRVFRLPSGLVVAVYEDTTAYRKAEEELWYHTEILNAIGEAVIATTPEGVITYWNGAAEEMYGWRAEDVLGRQIGEITVPIPRADEAEAIMAAVRNGETWSGDFTVQRYDGTTFIAHVTNTPILNSDRSVHSVIGVSNDVTERRKIEEELVRREAILSDAQRVANFGHYVFDVETGRWTHSEQLDQILGIGPEYEATVAGWAQIIHPDDRDELQRYLSDTVLGQHVPFDREYRIINQATKEERWVHGLGTLRSDATGTVTEMLGTIQDITDRKDTEKQLQALVAAKEDLLRETHHRVKNNLMMVASLLSLKDSSLGDAADLSDIRGQLDAIMHVHERLSRSDGSLEVPLDEYLEQIVATTLRGRGTGRFTAQLDVDQIFLSARQAVPIGLIVNEIATNTVKYGETPEGTSFFVTCRHNDGECTLEVGNTGPPLPDSVSLDHPDSLGLRLVTALVGQLHGSIRMKDPPRPHYVVRLRLE
jgi:PAS domain S-box-containing protein